MDKHIAAAAGVLLRDPAFKAACEKTEEKYVSAWKLSTPMAHEEREAAYHRLKALYDVIANIRSFFETAQAEAKAQDRKERLAKADL